MVNKILTTIDYIEIHTYLQITSSPCKEVSDLALLRGVPSAK